MRDVEFAEQLGTHLGKVTCVADVWQEACVARVEHSPVGTVHSGVIQLLMGLMPDVLEGLLTPPRGIIVVEAFEIYIGNLAAGDVELLDASALGVIGRLALIGDVEAGESHALCLDGSGAFIEVALPEGIAVWVVRGYVVELGSLFVDNSIADGAAVEGQAHGAQLQVAQVELRVKGFNAVGFLLLLLLLLTELFLLLVGLALLCFSHLGPFLVGLLLLLLSLLVGLFLGFLLVVLTLFLSLVKAFAFLLVHIETLVCLVGEEGDIEIALSAPRTMAAHACTVALEDECLAAEHPTRVAVAVARIGQVYELATAVGRHEHDVVEVPAAGADIL